MDNLRTVYVNEMGAYLMGHCSGNERFPRAGRTCQQNAPGGINPQKAEKFGKFQRKLGHLPDQGHFPVQAADVLVGDTVGLLRRNLGDFERDGCVRGNQQRPAWHRTFYCEGTRPLSQEGDLEIVTQDDRNAGKKLPEMGDLRLGGNGQTCLDGRQEQRLRRLEWDLAGCGPFIHADLGVFPRDSVDLDKTLPAMAGGCLGGARHCSSPAGDQQYVSRHGVQIFQILRV